MPSCVRAWLEVMAKLPDALVWLDTPCEGPWTDPLAILVLLVSYMPLAHGGLVSQKIDWISLRRGRTDIVRWDSKPQ